MMKISKLEIKLVNGMNEVLKTYSNRMDTILVGFKTATHGTSCEKRETLIKEISGLVSFLKNTYLIFECPTISNDIRIYFRWRPTTKANEKDFSSEHNNVKAFVGNLFEYSECISNKCKSIEMHFESEFSPIIEELKKLSDDIDKVIKLYVYA